MPHYKVRYLAVAEVDVRADTEEDALEDAATAFDRAQQGIIENFGVWCARIRPDDMGETLAAGQTEVELTGEDEGRE